MRVESRWGAERRNQEPWAWIPWLLERLSSENMASHPVDFSPVGDGFPLGSRQVWELDVKSTAWMSCCFLSFPVPLQVTPAAHPFIHPTSFSRRSY